MAERAEPYRGVVASPRPEHVEHRAPSLTGPLAQTGADAKGRLLAGAGVLLAAGGGALVAVRRRRNVADDDPAGTPLPVRRWPAAVHARGTLKPQESHPPAGSRAVQVLVSHDDSQRPGLACGGPLTPVSVVPAVRSSQQLTRRGRR
ncbi:LPXTG cell wall anchor domain-containing protein [Streptomyces sp. NPDC020858]|uniref:LPXTG cell wall anchor domain-containing protein n=1 Tax=Streptomyces sp. NPDC020858 TaxID=3365097 RepID=UPI0037A27D3B